MSNVNRPNDSGPERRPRDRRGPARRPIRVIPRRKTNIDPHLVALVYYLIASRIVRDAQDEQPASPPADEQDDVDTSQEVS